MQITYSGMHCALMNDQKNKENFKQLYFTSTSVLHNNIMYMYITKAKTIKDWLFAH